STGGAAQSAIDCADRLASSIWPGLAFSLGQAIAANSIATPRTVGELRRLCRILGDVGTFLSSYSPELFQENLQELLITLAPARSRAKTVWAFLTNREFGLARKRLRSLRTQGPASIRVLLEDARRASELLTQWKMVAQGDALPQPPMHLSELT